jgi:nicotinate-nucleotide adenylyltransferase
MGGDNLEQFMKWKNYEKILEYYGLYVYPRPQELSRPSGNVPTEDTFSSNPNIRLVDAPLLDISATFIRECIRSNRSIRYMVPEVVEEMITRKKFYL